MAKGRGALVWGSTASIVRASILAISGKEPPLEAFIPKPYLPEFTTRLTDGDREFMERLGAKTVEEAAEIIKAKKAKLDTQIFAQVGSAKSIRKG